MRVIELNKTGSLKARNSFCEFFLSDLETSIKSYAPGEWTYFVNPKRGESYIGFVNPMAQASSPCGFAIKKSAVDKGVNPWELVKELIESAIEKRSLISDYGTNGRMVYGLSDLLPGLIVDSFENCVLAQINTAGLDRFRDEIQKLLESLLKKPVYLLDNPEYRMSEGLPVYERDWSLERLEISEGDLKFHMPGQNLQKVGFYYDHRENRRKLSAYLGRLTKGRPRKGVDLFCYAGAWGMTMAKAGLEKVDFVDQGDFKTTVEGNWKLNALGEEPDFYRNNVFDFLKDAQKQGEKYDLIVSDPPAFCKSQKGVKKALEGYQRLHRACFRLLEDKSFFAACSCTHYVDMDAFAQNVNMAARQEGVRLTMLDMGSQGMDHPSAGFKDRANYLKYILFYVEKV